MSRANKVELEMLDLINAERAQAGLNALQLNTALNDSAEDHSAWMLNTNTFAHTGAGGSSAGDRMMDTAYPFEGSYGWAENIGWQSERGAPGISDDVADIHDSLMNSPGHRANILNPNLTEIGIGIETGAFTTARGTFDGVMVTQNFATTDGDVSDLADPGAGTRAEQVMSAADVPDPDAPVDTLVEPQPNVAEPVGAPAAAEPVAAAPVAPEPTAPSAPVLQDPEPVDEFEFIRAEEPVVINDLLARLIEFLDRLRDGGTEDNVSNAQVMGVASTDSDDVSIILEPMFDCV